LVSAQRDVEGLKDEVEATEAKIAATEERIASAKAKAEAEAAGDKYETLVLQLGEAIAAMEEKQNAMLDALKPVVAPLPLMHPSYVADLAATFSGVLAQLADLGGRAHRYIESIRCGAAPAPRPALEPVKVEPAPIVERKLVLVTRKGGVRYVDENGKPIGVGEFRTVSMPIAQAEAAIRNGFAVLPDSESARTLLAQIGGADYAEFSDAVIATLPDVMKPSPEVKYIDEHRSPNLHSMADQHQHDQRASWVNDGRREKTGTATVSAPTPPAN
jgi:hypothetical protein